MKLLIPNIRAAVSMTVLMTLLTGLAYPLAMTGVGQMLFPAQASGSLIKKGGTVIGSARIGQANSDPRYLLGRPSAGNYDAANSGGSNLGPSSRELIATVRDRVKVMHKLDGNMLPAVDRVTASGSGLDPHLSLAAALQQVGRIARLRGTEPRRVREILERYIEGAYMGVIGEPVVNVLLANLALDEAFPLKERDTAGAAGAIRRNPND
ncbi:MAG: potassium-transporting ATPase subunit KdpC [Alphaproteobacteria bacterium]|nr:potassium-transporting ATPase subunit KdpC [Alphaproteobacteria bacterium]